MFLCSVNCMLYCISFIYSQVFSFNIAAIFFITLFMVFLLLLINPISSAYCRSFIVSYVVFVLFYAVIVVMNMFNGC